MSCYDHILAKSEKYGSIPLTAHLLSTAYFAQMAAEYYGVDMTTAHLGGLLHDIGKASLVFQKRLREERLFSARPFRHEIASLFFLKLLDREKWHPVIDMIVSHHKSIIKDGKECGILDLDNLEGDDSFRYHVQYFDEWSRDAIGILREVGFPDIHEDTKLTVQDAYEAYQYVVEYCRSKKRNWSVWKGLLVGADHIASATEGFKEKIPKLFTVPDITFYTRRSPLYPLSLIESDERKTHTFVMAPTGAGKTDFLLKRCKGRIFYILPFQASINAMYERIKEDLKGKTDDVRLLHAVSKLIIQEDKIVEERAIQNKFGSAVKVLTPHQLASIVLGTKGYESILFDIKGCDIILDEIHTYSEIMQSIVLKMIEIMDSLGCRIHIGTATMPKVLEDAILNLLPSPEIQYVKLEDEILDSFNRHIIHKVSSMDDLWEVMEENIRENQKILIVCNTVKKAQELYRTLKDKYPKVKKMLVHSRYKRKDRNNLENSLKNKYNKSIQACLVVTTQVVEVSLDISFDMMITETAPIDSLIQRFGRINRVRTKEMNRQYKPIYVITPPPNKRDCMPYDSELLQRSFEVLPDHSLLEERKIQQLIDQVYRKINIIDIDLDAAFQDGTWGLKELQHIPKSALTERLDIDSVSCIRQSDREFYETASAEERTEMEIPVRFSLMRWTKLEQLEKGSRPFVIPDQAYTREEGMDTSKLSVEYYNVEYNFL